MRAVTFVSLVVTTGALAALACGGATPPPPPAPPPPVTEPVVTPTASNVGDAGPGSTTTATLTGGGGAGTKLTPLGSADAGADHGKHHGELGRTVADIQAIVSSHRDEVRACYDNALPGHPGIEGNLDVRWTIDPSGKVTEADLDTSDSQIVEPAVVNCVVAVIKKIHFNASAKGFETKAHYPFNFHPRAKHTVNVGDGT